MAKTPEIVRARYTGGATIVMPDLMGPGRERPDKAEALKAWLAAPEGLNPQCVVVTGDVIPLDRASAEGRSDFELVTKAKE